MTRKPKKTNKQRDNLTKTILQYMGGKRYEPLGVTDLLKRLSIPKELQPLCKQIIESLLKEGIVIKQKRQLVLKEAKAETMTGTLRMNPRGFGFVIPDHPLQYPQDIFIPKHLTDNAVDGDQVEVVVFPDSGNEKGPEGKIVGVLERARTHIGGTVWRLDHSGNVVAFAPLLGQTKPILLKKSEKHDLKIGDRIIIKIDEWGDEKSPTTGQLSHYIGHISDPSCDIAAAIEEFDIRSTFSREAVDQAKDYGKTVTKADQKKRTDLTKLECFTIDPDTAKDFDDALTIEKDKKGNYFLGVHIADVAHYVKSGTPLDKESSERCNSTYLPGTCIPMLPEELSNHLCSLRADVIRLTASVLMDFNPQGDLVGYKIVRSFIKSAKRFTYEEAKEVIDGKKKSPHATALKHMVELCLLLKKKRYERGSIDFSLPELVILIDEKGMPTGTKLVEYDISHQLVEEFMLKANEITAKHLSDQGKPALFRIHEEPSAENMEDFYALARTLGFTLPSKPTHADLQLLFEKAKGTSFGQQLSVGFIRSMKLAYYSAENVGHYGLGLEYYCHFTSPIRRYTDLIIQRLLFDEMDEDTDLEKVAKKCSDQERVSFKAESSVKTLKKLRLLKTYYDKNPRCQYEAVVTRIKSFGLSFEISELMLEGFLHVSELEDDFFIYDDRRNVLFGRSRGMTHSVGEKITVMVSTIDFIVLETKWHLVSDNPRRRKR